MRLQISGGILKQLGRILVSLQSSEVPLKRYVLFGLLVAVVCAPLFFVAFLLTAANVPAMDRLTLAMPQTIREAVAQLALNSHGAKDKATRARVLMLDPSNDQLNGRVVTLVRGGRNEITIAGDEAAASKLNALGLKQENEGDPCTAEDTFTQANTSANGGNTEYLRNMGRAAYECGRYAYSVSEFGAAEDHDARELAADPDDADLDAELAADREWLSLAYTATRQPELANEACLRAHTGWKGCRCTLKLRNPVCTQAATPSPLVKPR
jgi:tetratricopeptide (TPR) repeat protein